MRALSWSCFSSEKILKGRKLWGWSLESVKTVSPAFSGRWTVVGCYSWKFLFSFFMQLKFYPPTFLPYISSSPWAPHGELQLMDEFRADFVPCSRGRNMTQACFPRETQALGQNIAWKDQHSLEPGRQPLSLRQHYRNHQKGPFCGLLVSSLGRHRPRCVGSHSATMWRTCLKMKQLRGLQVQKVGKQLPDVPVWPQV